MSYEEFKNVVIKAMSNREFNKFKRLEITNSHFESNLQKNHHQKV